MERIQFKARDPGPPPTVEDVEFQAKIKRQRSRSRAMAEDGRMEAVFKQNNPNAFEEAKKAMDDEYGKKGTRYARSQMKNKSNVATLTDGERNAMEYQQKLDAQSRLEEKARIRAMPRVRMIGPVRPPKAPKVPHEVVGEPGSSAQEYQNKIEAQQVQDILTKRSDRQTLIETNRKGREEKIAARNLRVKEITRSKKLTRRFESNQRKEATGSYTHRSMPGGQRSAYQMMQAANQKKMDRINRVKV